MGAEQQIPRFHAYFERMQGKTVMWMSRSDWDEIQARTTGYAFVNIDATPMKRVAAEASVVAAVAFAHSETSGQLNVYRIHQRDYPNEVNEDRYSALLHIAKDPSLPNWVTEASTSLNADLIGFLESNIAFVKMDPDPKHHHLPALPATVQAVLDLHVKST